ncbi:MAG: serine/threonine-protein kinase [Acidobacteriota bacterium]
MDSQRWQRVKEVFHAARGLSPEEGRDYLATLGDDALAEEVASLLAAHRQATGFVDRPAFELLGDAPPTWPDQIGPYRILDLLGEGGMGVVYLALRDDQTFEKTVALKVLSRHLATPDLATRFRAERQILADLEHPGIARLLDGGTTDDGLPYLVVEHVAGRSIDRYVREEGLSLDQRLVLLIELCAAVHAAHQRLVVHRDLKPANVLVTAAGAPRLLDFGIAKLLGAGAGEALTVAGDRLMTPPYASPEQLRGDAVTTATDVYALGVLAFELITGVHPHGGAEAPPHELARSILERPPRRPSTVVAEAPATAPKPPDRYLERALRGDLDRIVLKALQAEPERRYASAEALGRDLESYRQGLPVSAQPDTFAYRSAKFVRRHRWPVALVTVAVTTLLALTTLLLVQRSEILRQRDRAESVSSFLVRLFESADPSHSRGAEITAGELLDQARREIERPGLSQETVADLMLTMGDAYAGLGLYASAGELLDGAVARRRTLYREPHGEVAEALASLGRVRIGEGELEAAEGALQAAFEQRRRRLGGSHPETAESLADLGALRQRQGRLGEAEAAYREAAEILAGIESEILARVLHRHAGLERERGRYDQAERLERRALEQLRGLRGEAPDPLAATLTVALGTIRRRAGDDAGAEVLYREALAEQQRLFPQGHPDLAVTLSHLASTATRQGRFDEADELLEEAITLRLRLLGPDHPLVANALNNRGNLAADRGRLEQAEDLYRRALALQQRALPANHRDLAATRSNLGLVLDGRQRHGAAEALHRQALATYRGLYGDDHVRVAVVRNNLAESLKGQRRDAEARHELTAAVDVLRRHLGDDHPTLATLLSNLAAVERRLGEIQRAGELYGEALTIAESRLGADNPTTLRIAANRLILRLAQAPSPTLRQEARDLRQRLIAALGADHPSVGELDRALTGR